MSETLILLLIAVVAIVIIGWGFGKSPRDTLMILAIAAVLIASRAADSPEVRKLWESLSVAERQERTSPKVAVSDDAAQSIKRNRGTVSLSNRANDFLRRNRSDYRSRGRIDRASTGLHNAVADGNAVKVRRIISDGANVNATNTSGGTPLHSAAWHGHTEIANALIKAGANVFARTNDGHTPLDLAIQAHGKDSDIALFLQAEMKPTPPFRQSRRYQNKRQN